MIHLNKGVYVSTLIKIFREAKSLAPRNKAALRIVVIVIQKYKILQLYSEFFTHPSRFMNIFNLDTQTNNEYYQFLVGFPSVFTFRELDSRQKGVHCPAVED